MDILEFLRRKRMGMVDSQPITILPAKPGMDNSGAITTLPVKPGMGINIEPTMYSNSINPPWGVNPRGVGSDITIPPARRVNTPGVLDPATGQNRVLRQGPTMTPYSEDYMMADAVPTPASMSVNIPAELTMSNDPDYSRKMQSIQEAMLNGADFGYESEWSEGLGVSDEMIDRVMSTPIEAMIFAAQNPTDMVLEEFERKYGWPLNVNSPALMRYIAEMGQ